MWVIQIVVMNFLVVIFKRRKKMYWNWYDVDKLAKTCLAKILFVWKLKWAAYIYVDKHVRNQIMHWLDMVAAAVDQTRNSAKLYERFEFIWRFMRNSSH